jgi:isoleucyl-tRNA synthetase
LAPIIPFTAEEIWDHCGFLPDREPSVHLAAWPQPPPEWRDEDLAREWEDLLRLRDEALKLLEEFRRRGGIGNSLEAAVTIRVPEGPWAQMLRKHRDHLSSYLIVSRVEVEEGVDFTGEEGFQAVGIEGMAIKLDRAPGEKCPRCWKYRDLLRSAFAAEPVCPDCRSHLNAVSAQSYQGGDSEEEGS